MPTANDPKMGSKLLSIIDHPAAWQGSNMGNNPCWQFALDANDIDELNVALATTKEQLDTIGQITAANFKIPLLQQKLTRLGDQLEHGCGFARLRGLPIDRWSADDLEWVWMGIASHIGSPVFQNPQGQILREIKAEGGDVGARYGQLEAKEGQFLSSRARTASNAALRYHTDRCDVVGLLCTGVAREGGLSKIASSIAVHNEMLRRYPEQCRLLYQNLPRSRVGEEVGGEKHWYELPVWTLHQGHFSSHYSRTYVEALEHVAGAPQVSVEQWQALDNLAKLAEELHLAMQLDVGDIQFLNNHVIYHSRGAFVDQPEAGFQRCLWRIWLSAPHRPLRDDHAVLWRQVEPGQIRGGISEIPL